MGASVAVLCTRHGPIGPHIMDERGWRAGRLPRCVALQAAGQRRHSTGGGAVQHSHRWPHLKQAVGASVPGPYLRPATGVARRH